MKCFNGLKLKLLYNYLKYNIDISTIRFDNLTNYIVLMLFGYYIHFYSQKCFYSFAVCSKYNKRHIIIKLNDYW